MSTGPHADVDWPRGQRGDQQGRPDRQLEAATGRFGVLERGVDPRTCGVHDKRSRRPSRTARSRLQDEERQTNISDQPNISR